MGSTPPRWRRSGGNVSGRPSIAISSSSTPKTARAANTPRHCVHRSNSLPRVGARIGAAPITSNRRDSSWAKAVPLNRSRTTAMAMTAAAAAPRPWITRSAPSTVMFGARAQHTDAAMCSAVPAISGARRPTASESGPISSCPRARPMRVPVRVSWTAAEVVPRSSTIEGSAGRYMSMVSGPTAISEPRTRMRRRRWRRFIRSPGISAAGGAAVSTPLTGGPPAGRRTGRDVVRCSYLPATHRRCADSRLIQR